jgi:uncharacterized protein
MACCASDGEAILAGLGFRQCRVLADGAAARIEVAHDEISRLSDPEIANVVHEGFRRLGFLYVSINLDGTGLGSQEDGGLVSGLPPEEE